MIRYTISGAGLAAVAAVSLAVLPAAGLAAEPSQVVFRDATGTIATAGTIDLRNPFFQNLGTNGRTCATCHQFSDGMSITPAHIRMRFLLSLGTDPVFRPVDGSNCDNLDVSTVAARWSAYSLLLNKGLIRVALPVPSGAEFTVLSVDNPYGCSSTSMVSVYRRPLPASNLRFLSTVMWDGRESFPGKTIEQNLAHQANDATMGHAQGAALSDAVQQQIVAFEIGLHTAQSRDNIAGNLAGDGARGGPVALSRQPFFIGINDPLGQNPTGAPFNPEAFDIFSGWLTSLTAYDAQARMRQSIARGERMFNLRPIEISGVGGLSDMTGTCTTCHDTPNVGNHSVTAPLNIGLNDVSRRTPDLPLFTLQNNNTLEIVQTLDPGRALISGKWADIGKTKGPILRGLAARAPYFHNGSAATLSDVLDFYETRFHLGLTAQEKTDLINFLNSL